VTQAANTAAPFEAPRGVLTSRVDDKGRLKLPAAVKAYFDSLDEKTLFVTSLDLRVVSIYPIAVWRENEMLLERLAEEIEDAEDLAFLAQDVGIEVKPDAQGRLLIPQQLRKLLGLENQPVYLNSFKGRINVFAKEVYEQLQAKARAQAPERARKLKMRGLK